MSPEKSFQNPSRLEAFSDGVFSIAITLLVLSIIEIPRPHSDEPILLKTLAHHWTSFLSYLIGFLTILVCWINHHFICVYIKRSDSFMYILNGLLLLVVTLVPFSTVVLADYAQEADQQTAIALYGATFVVMAISYFSMWTYAHRKKLLDENIDEGKRKAIHRMYSMGIVYTLLTLAITFMNFYVSLIFYVLLFALFFIPEIFSEKIRSIKLST